MVIRSVGIATVGAEHKQCRDDTVFGLLTTLPFAL